MITTRLTNVLAAAAVAILLTRPIAAADLSGAYIAQVTTTPGAEPQFARVSLRIDGTTVTGQ
jgi:hypothetical protein